MFHFSTCILIPRCPTKCTLYFLLQILRPFLHTPIRCSLPFFCDRAFDCSCLKERRVGFRGSLGNQNSWELSSETLEEMIADSLNNGKSSGKEVEGGDSLRTLECLRGRLIAERQSSKLAKERVEILGSKLMELEREMKTEIETRERAEKKLRFLMKKLQALNISISFLDSVNAEALQTN